MNEECSVSASRYALSRAWRVADMTLPLWGLSKRIGLLLVLKGLRSASSMRYGELIWMLLGDRNRRMSSPISKDRRSRPPSGAAVDERRWRTLIGLPCPSLGSTRVRAISEPTMWRNPTHEYVCHTLSTSRSGMRPLLNTRMQWFPKTRNQFIRYTVACRAPRRRRGG